MIIFGLVAFVLIFGCINITQTQESGGAGVQQPLKPPKQPGQVATEENQSDSGQEAANGTEGTDESGTGNATPMINITKKPLLNLSKINYTKEPEITINKNKTINVNLYTFLNKTPDFSGLPKPTDSQACREECDDYCEDDMGTCMDACGFSWNNLCANAAAAAGVCQASCAAIPFPWVIADCIEECQDEFEETCNTNDLHGCQNNCAGDHYELCIDTCYELC